MNLLLLPLLTLPLFAAGAELAQGKSMSECEAELGTPAPSDKTAKLIACMKESSAKALRIRCTEQQALVVANARADLKGGQVEAASTLKECAPYFVDDKTKAFYKSVLAAERKKAARILATDQAREKAERKKRSVHIGMTAAEVIQSSWGRPDYVNRTTTAYGVREQWVYGQRSYLYFQDGILDAIQN